MKPPSSLKIFSPRALGLLLWPALASAAAPATPASAIDFNRHIRPILSENCFACHGPDESKRKSQLRLDLKADAFKPAKSGALAIVPGQSAESELIRRVTHADEDDVMPPVKTGKQLKPEQITLLRQWIAHGADWKSHWSFEPVKSPALPVVSKSAWVRNPIDRFALARLDAEKLPPSPEADRATLIRRVTLDLTGLPPTPAEVDAFLADKSANAYEKLVDRLLASPRYGERMAVDWLDAARFADTHGYHIDSGRDMTIWREWVIEAFNKNLPFDQFTTWQLAGDLLPNATTPQKIASGFNRNHMINFEGGANADEYLTAYIIDRVNTTATVWLGLTVACAQCHDHKFDPIAQRDYYRLYAFFNGVPENGMDGGKGNAVPLLRAPTRDMEAQLATLTNQLAAAEARAKELEAGLPAAQVAWEKVARAATREPSGLLVHFPLDESLAGRDAGGQEIKAAFPTTNAPAWTPGKIGRGLKLDGTEKSFVAAGMPVNFNRTDAFSSGCWVKQTGQGTGALLAKMDEAAQLRGFDLLVADGKLYFHLISAWPGNALRVSTKAALPKDAWTHVFATYDGSGKSAGLKLYVNGREALFDITNDNLTGPTANQAPLNLGRRSEHLFKGSLDDVRIYGRVLAAPEVAELAGRPLLELVALAPEQRTPEQQAELKKYFREQHAGEFTKSDQAAAALRKSRDELTAKFPTTMVMQEMAKPRPTHLLMRGQFDKKGDPVTAGTPASLPPLPDGAPTNRLGLAQWLVSPQQPLTARVIVNRYWQMYFGTGLVKTAEDFGSQGEWPSHPELLDWLAAEFMAHWDVKAMQRLIVTSATYRQASRVTPELYGRDPENRLFARGPRLRLQAEFIRDQALAVSGLLSGEIGGKSVSPYQPPGLWEELASREDGKNWTAQTYTQSHGPDLYRRTMYTFWKRTSPPAQLSTFDAPDRETCTVRRPRTNTPLQALILMNDPTYVEASRKLAERMMTEAADDRQRILLAFRLATARPPTDAEMKVLLKLYLDQLAIYRANGAAALKLLGNGEAPRNEKLDPAVLAAWTMVASTILNLDETLTKG